MFNSKLLIALLSINMSLCNLAWGQTAAAAPVVKGAVGLIDDAARYTTKYADDAWRFLKGQKGWADDAAKVITKNGADDAAKAGGYVDDAAKASVKSGVDDAAKAGGGYVDDAAKNSAKSGADDVMRAGGKVVGGNSAVLAARIGTPKGYAAHHLIPVSLKEHPILAKIGMDLDEIGNGISLPTLPGIDPKLPLHRGSHPAYTNYVKKKLDEIPDNLSPADIRRRINALQRELKGKLESGKQLHANFGGEW
jgi:hypothetical protein